MNINHNGRSYANVTKSAFAVGISSRGAQPSSILSGSQNRISPTWVSFHWPEGEELERLTAFRDTELNDMEFFFVEDLQAEVSQERPDIITVVHLVSKHVQVTGTYLKDVIRDYMGPDGSQPLPENSTLAFCKGRLVVIKILVNRADFLIDVRPIGDIPPITDFTMEASVTATEMLLEVFSKYTPEQAAQALMHKRMKDIPRARSVLEAILQGVTLTGD